MHHVISHPISSPNLSKASVTSAVDWENLLSLANSEESDVSPPKLGLYRPRRYIPCSWQETGHQDNARVVAGSRKLLYHSRLDLLKNISCNQASDLLNAAEYLKLFTTKMAAGTYSFWPWWNENSWIVQTYPIAISQLQRDPARFRLPTHFSGAGRCHRCTQNRKHYSLGRVPLHYPLHQKAFRTKPSMSKLSRNEHVVPPCRTSLESINVMKVDHEVQLDLRYEGTIFEDRHTYLGLHYLTIVVTLAVYWAVSKVTPTTRNTITIGIWETWKTIREWGLGWHFRFRRENQAVPL